MRTAGSSSSSLSALHVGASVFVLALLLLGALQLEACTSSYSEDTNSLLTAMRSTVAAVLWAWPMVAVAAPPSPPGPVGPPQPPAALGLRRFSSLVMFGDSWTDSGLRNYQPDANGNVGQPVSFYTRQTFVPLMRYLSP